MTGGFPSRRGNRFHATACMMTSSNGNIFRTVNSLHKGQWRGALMFSLICVWINDWISNREAGDLRRYRAHYDVIVMVMIWCLFRRCQFVLMYRQLDPYLSSNISSSNIFEEKTSSAIKNFYHLFSTLYRYVTLNTRCNWKCIQKCQIIRNNTFWNWRCYDDNFVAQGSSLSQLPVPPVATQLA